MAFLRHRFAPLLALLLFTALFTYPTLLTLTTHVIDRQDPLLNSWILAWEARALLLGEADSLFTTNIFYPLENSLAFSEILLSTSLLVMPLTWATDNAILSYNVAFLFAFFSTALGAYLLALYLTGNRGAALVAALAFAWSPYRMGHLSQLQLLMFGWLPLAFIYLDRLLRGKGKPLQNGVLLGLFFALQALASFYSALFGGVAFLLYGVGWLLWRRRLTLASLTGLLVAGVLVAALVIPFTLPYFEVQQELGAGWTLEDNERFSASVQAYGYAPEGSLLWGAITRPLAYTYGACCPPDSLFPGITLVTLSLFALWKARGARRGLWVLVGAVALTLSLGPTLTITAGSPTDVSLPYYWLYENVPLFNAIRAPVRWAVLLTLALAMLAAIGVARWRWRAGWIVALGLVALEFIVFPLRVVPLPVAPESLAWLAAQPPTRVLEYPLVAERPTPPVEGEEWQAPRRRWESSRLLEMQYFSTFHWHTTVDGYSGYVPTRHGDYARELTALPAERAFTVLRGMGFEYVVVHENDLTETARARWAQPLPEGVTEAARFGDERVLRLAPYMNAATNAWLSVPALRLPPNTTVTVPLVVLSEEPVVLGSDYREMVRVSGMESGALSEIPVTYPPILDGVTVLTVPVTTPENGDFLLTVESMLLDKSASGSITIDPAAPPVFDFLPVTLENAERTGNGQYRLTWRSHQGLAHDYSISVRLVDTAGTVLAQQDGAPGRDVPTTAWLAGEAYGAEFTLTPDAENDKTHLEIIWYDPAREIRAQIWHGATFAEILTLNGVE